MIKEIYEFKVKGFTTILVGQRYYNEELEEYFFYVQRADGNRYEYPNCRVEYYKLLIP